MTRKKRAAGKRRVYAALLDAESKVIAYKIDFLSYRNTWNFQVIETKRSKEKKLYLLLWQIGHSFEDAINHLYENEDLSRRKVTFHSRGVIKRIREDSTLLITGYPDRIYSGPLAQILVEASEFTGLEIPKRNPLSRKYEQLKLIKTIDETRLKQKKHKSVLDLLKGENNG